MCLEEWQAGGNWITRAAERLKHHGVTYTKLTNWIRDNGIRELLDDTVSKGGGEPTETLVDKRARSQVLRQEREELQAVTGEKSVRMFLERLVRGVVPSFPAAPPYQAPKVQGKVTTETLGLMLSDWHAYETVSAERTRGFNEYNAKIFGQRVYQIVQSAISIKQKIESGGRWRFPRLVVGANGDFVSGTIHEVERHYDAPNIVMAVYGTAHVLAQALRDLAGEFESVDVFCSPGNHGRLPDARRVQDKDPTRSWDTLIYLMAEQMLANQPNVRFYIPNSYSVAFTVEGWNFLQTHGHDIQSWNQIPWYGMQRAISSISALEAARGSAIHYFLWGHFHTKIAMDVVTGESLVNGSLIGATEWSLAKFNRADPPKQIMFGVHKEHGVTHQWSLRALAKDNAKGYLVKPWEG